MPRGRPRNTQPTEDTRYQTAPAAPTRTTSRGNPTYRRPNAIELLASTIRVLTTENPKKPGTGAFERFKLYKDGQRVLDYVSSGGLTADIWSDRGRGYIEIERPRN